MKNTIFPLVLLSLSFAAHPQAATPEVGKALPAWSKGELDIHHINTGRGDALFFILPDGTTMMEDFSGKTVEKPPFSLPTKPDASRSPGEWVARYAQRALPKGVKGIDYALISHFHGDHMGAVVKDSPTAKNGAYQLSGITEFAEHFSIAKVLDRGWPSYDYPEPIRNATVDNYRAFLDWQMAHNGMKVERFTPGRDDQITLLRDAKKYPGFSIRNVYSDGIIWTGEGSKTRNLIPSLSSLEKSEYPAENALSNVFVLHYGKFDYFSGGDLDEPMALINESNKWRRADAFVGKVVGRVDAMKANHHGSWNANSGAFLAFLQPRVIVVTSRAEGHPAVNTWARMTSNELWPDERDIFVTNVSEATAKTTYGLDKKAKSTQGHVVIRVAPGGHSYRVFAIEDDDERMLVKAVFGPYTSN